MIGILRHRHKTHQLLRTKDKSFLLTGKDKQEKKTRPNCATPPNNVKIAGKKKSKIAATARRSQTARKPHIENAAKQRVAAKQRE